MKLLWCYAVIMTLFCCYYEVVMMLLCCYYDVIVMLCCYCAVIIMLLWWYYYILLLWCYYDVMLLWWCYYAVMSYICYYDFIIKTLKKNRHQFRFLLSCSFMYFFQNIQCWCYMSWLCSGAVQMVKWVFFFFVCSCSVLCFSINALWSSEVRERRQVHLPAPFLS